MRVRHRLALLAIGGAALLPVAPASAGIGIGDASMSPTDDAQMCLSLYTPSPSPMVGTATATGAVHTVSGIATTLPSTLVADVRPLASTTGYASVCVGGTGKTADGGAVLFTFDLHGVSGDYLFTALCTYSPSGPSCL